MILSPKHLDTLITPIDNIKCPKNAKNACAEWIYFAETRNPSDSEMKERWSMEVHTYRTYVATILSNSEGKASQRNREKHGLLPNPLRRSLPGQNIREGSGVLGDYHQWRISLPRFASWDGFARARWHDSPVFQSLTTSSRCGLPYKVPLSLFGSHFVTRSALYSTTIEDRARIWRQLYCEPHWKLIMDGYWNK